MTKCAHFNSFVYRFELMRDTRTPKIRAASDLWKDVHYKQTQKPTFHPATALGGACSGLTQLFFQFRFFFLALL